MRKGILVHPEELSRRWIDRTASAGIEVLGLHPVGGSHAADSLKALNVRLENPGFRALLDYATARGLEIEYEMHAASYLLPRELFAAHPEYFREDETGTRTPDRNLCPSNADAMDIVVRRATELTLSLYRSCNRFYFWLDDVRGKHCMCKHCRELSASDQQLIYVNSILAGIKRQIPDAQLAYLAYFDCMEPPRTVKPEAGVFLEYAPFEKYRIGADGNRTLADHELAMTSPLLEYFGKDNAKVLEYWLDNSLFSEWKKPPKPFSCRREPIAADLAMFKRAGFDSVASFACYLGEDYEKLYGAPDITPFISAFKDI